MKRAFFRRSLAGVLACLMMLAAFAAPAAVAEMPMPSAMEMGIQVVLQYTDPEGNPIQFPAVPVYEVPNVYWVQVPAEYMGSLTLLMQSPTHAFVFTPENGSPLAAMDAGMDLTGPSVPITAVEGEGEGALMVSFLLYVSTMTAYPMMEPVITEVPVTPEPITEVPVTEVPVTPEPITEVPVTEVPVTPEPITEVPVTEVPVTPEPITEVPVTEVPVTQEPITEVLPTEVPVTPEPITEVPVTEVPVTPEPITEVPVTEVPVTPEPITEVPPTEAPTVEPIPEDATVIQPGEDEVNELPGEDPVNELPGEDPVNELPADDQTGTLIPETEVPETEEPVTEVPTEEPTPEPVETPIPMGEMINRFGIINNKQVAIRSEMSTVKKDTVLNRANKGNYIYILQERVNDNGEPWMAVLYGGRVAYVMSKYLDVLTQAESDAYMTETGEFVPAMTAEELYALEGPAETEVPVTEVPVTEEPVTEEPVPASPETAETQAEENPVNGVNTITNENQPNEEPPVTEEPVPETQAPTETPEPVTPPPTDTPEPTPPETPIPMGEMINRFARTTKGGIHVRTAPNGKAKLAVKDQKKGANVYAVREELNEDNVAWTRVIIDGKTGYIRSEFLEVLTQAESDAVMAGWKGTPVPPVTAEELAAQDATEVPETEAPETEAPETEAPETEAPATEAPATEPPATETTESAAGISQPPVTEAPVTEPPVTEAPVTEPPVTEAPVTEPPVTEPPVTEAPVTEPPITEEPVTPIPVPVTDPPITVEPVTEEPVTAPPETVPPTDSPAPVPGTPEPPQISGYGITIGDGAYVRNWPASNSVIVDDLPANKVVFVNAQIWTDSVAWHQVKYDGKDGYIRADMLRMMGTNEVIQYLDNLNATPQPTAQITVEPLNNDSLSSYGYTTTTVNFRSAASMSASRLRQLKRYALCLVLGSTQTNGETWYRVTFDGQTGYIKADYFKHMTLSEMEEFLKSPNYLEGITNNRTGSSSSSGTSGTSSSGTGTSSSSVPSAEDERVSTWTNPESGIVVSYAPFDPFATAAPVATESPNDYLDSLVEEILNGTMTRDQVENLLKLHFQGQKDADAQVAEGLKYIDEKLAAAETPTVSPEQPTEEPTATVEPVPPTENDGPGAAGWVIGAAAFLALGGVGYAVYTSQLRKRRAAAQAAAQKRAAAQRRAAQSGNQAGAARPGTPTGKNGTTAPGKSTVPGTTAAAGMAGAAAKGAQGDKSSPYARPAAQSGTGAAAGTPKPYENKVENPYGRYSTRDGEDPGYTASFRPSESSAPEEDWDSPKPASGDDWDLPSYTASFRPQGAKNAGKEGESAGRRRRRTDSQPTDDDF